MILRQFLHNDPVGISYMFGCGGESRRHNRAFAILEADFVEFMLQEIPAAPIEAATLRAINSGRARA